MNVSGCVPILTKIGGRSDLAHRPVDSCPRSSFINISNLFGFPRKQTLKQGSVYLEGNLRKPFEVGN